MGDIRDEWRLRDIERKADDASRRLYEIDALRRDVADLERTTRELRSECDGLRSELQGYQDWRRQIEQQIAEIATPPQKD